tara:strand:- start:4306 stop:5124 length:819 start_codon:yes stop_codon:yes gene_type:complete
MRLGVSYNVFDGEEHLEESISRIRESVDFVCIVYQTTSNYGEKRDDLEPFLADLKVRGLVDYMYCYNPKEVEGGKRGEINEIIKRNIGRDICVKVANCTHHITLDCDEMFVSEEFEWAKQEVIKNNYDTTYVSYDNYYKKNNLKICQSSFLNKTGMKIGNLGYISFIVKCDKRHYGQGISPVIVDPTRTIDCNKFEVFNRGKIKMHHYSYIRNSEESLRRKLNNTSFKQHQAAETGIEKVVQNFINYKDGEKASIMWLNGCLEIDLINVKSD